MFTAKETVPLTDEQRDLVAEHAWFSVDYARRVTTRLDRDDAAQEATIGMISAAKRFDPRTNDRFPAFACHRALGAIRDADRQNGTIRIGRHGRERGGEDAQRAMGIGPLNYPVYDDSEDVLDEACRREWHERFYQILGTMDDRDQVVVLERLKGKTQREIGAKIGLTESRVSQVLTEILRRIGTRMQASGHGG